MKHMAIVGLALILLQGCGGNSINLRAARNYAAAGYQAMHAGDWKNAQTYFSRAILNAQLAKAGPRAMAVLKYEYGRSSGVICDWGEAQAGLNEAYDLDRQNAGPAYMSLYELARLNLDRRDYPKAKEYFEQAFAEFQKIGADTRDPLAYAEFLEEYAVTLENTWSGTEAFAHRERALEIRGTFPAGKSHTEKTPYGAQCAPASGDAGDADRPAKEIGFSRRRNSPEAACIRGNSPSFLKHLFC
ncbi:MAG: hypothetical protein EXR36_02555 [Betaproteobacteria bacterium]|nr:hypothetical protein [Betaproteobacteria bacterium]